ncbi:MAG: ABC transporter permease [Clostridiales Family XIII bacterium]|jgi:ABC-type nitrate/sulfonate/bicarbonate transport system permease component|nr:ABC transporter permease [Clostridiales Family XIII bacterium]
MKTVLTGSNKKRRWRDALYPVATVVAVVAVWELIVRAADVPAYLVPAPSAIALAFVSDFGLIASHARATMFEAAVGLSLSVAIAFGVAMLMDNFPAVRKALYPLLIMSQTAPVIAVAPILIIWFGFGALPKVVIVVLMCFFPICVSLTDGFAETDKDFLDYFHLIKATRLQVYRHLKIPHALPYFFAGLKIAVTYTVMAAVIAEWLGGNEGIGVYMLRAKQSFALDRMFAAIALVVAVSLILIALVDLAARRVVYWKAGAGEGGVGE